MSNNKPHFSYINVSLLVLSNLKIVFKLKKIVVHYFFHNVRYLHFWMVKDLWTLFWTMFWLVPSLVTSKIWISRCVVDIKLRSYSFVSRIRTLVKTLRHHVTILDLFRTLLDPSYYMIHINIVLVKLYFSRGYYTYYNGTTIRSQL